LGFGSFSPGILILSKIFEIPFTGLENLFKIPDPKMEIFGTFAKVKNAYILALFEENVGKH
jgi:hypothetical protein